MIQEALGHRFEFSWRGVCREPVNCALRMTSGGVFSDILSRYEKDGPVPKAQPKDVSDFSLYAPATKPCGSGTYKRPG